MFRNFLGTTAVNCTHGDESTWASKHTGHRVRSQESHTDDSMMMSSVRRVPHMSQSTSAMHSLSNSVGIYRFTGGGVVTGRRCSGEVCALLGKDAGRKAAGIPSTSCRCAPAVLIPEDVEVVTICHGEVEIGSGAFGNEET